MLPKSFSISRIILVLIFSSKLVAASESDVKLSDNRVIAFTENKGQVHDQNYKQRNDILYGVVSGNLSVHIKTKGLSYQLYRTDAYKVVEDLKTNSKIKEPAKQTVHRIDIDWVNANSNFLKKEGRALPGYSNYYLQNCQNGILKVKSYSDVTLVNLYQGIDLHYYSVKNALKHDYIVAAHANYKQIKLHVRGAVIQVTKEGTLLLKTELGIVQEGAPLVFQKGLPLKSRWLISHDTLSFEIEGYDPKYELVIDPLTRLWGTYYGANGSAGDGSEYGYSCATDANNNVFLSGYCYYSSGTVIATTGAHQATMNTNDCDAFLVKFNSNGLRIWGTYYGGSSGERGYGCTADLYGNVYLTGTTSSTAGIATAAGHQTVFSASAFVDAYLVKFDANGVRQWGTYYGNVSNEWGLSCVADTSGNVYMSGMSNSNSLIASSGAHQTTVGGGQDAFLVKFNGNGVRLWATYYGGTGDDVGWTCDIDGLGNVYLGGTTSSTNANVMATSGSHQPSTTYGYTDAFLVKFTSAGVRIWGTYYGGMYGESGKSCAVDVYNNVYLCGSTNTSTNNIATPGSHQTSYAGGTYDAYIVKFDANGVRQWGTYYGANASDEAYACATDVVGNVYLVGSTTGSMTTVLATAASHQTIMASSTDDAFLVKFNTNGVRLAGTYYGSTLVDYGMSCATDAAGNIYLAGITAGGTGLGSFGSHQPAFGGAVCDAYLAKFEECTAPPAQPISIIGSSVVCAGQLYTFSTTPAYGASTYTWAMPPNWMGYSNSLTIVAAAGASGVFTLMAGNGCGVSPQQTLNITVNPVPTVVVNSGAICAGQAFTIVASGASTYSYSSGPVVTPSVTSSFQVTGTNTLGCSHTVISHVNVYPRPVISVSSGAICKGQSYTIIPSGASTYTFSGGTAVVSPLSTTSYSVTGKSSAGCISSNTAISTVTVHALPSLSVSTSNSQICVGESATLTVSGASTYTFDANSVGAQLTISPTVTTIYNVIGKDANGCSNTTTFQQEVNECTGIQEKNATSDRMLFYPNPTHGIISISMEHAYHMAIVNSASTLVYSSSLEAGKHRLNLEHLANGLYVIEFKNDTQVKHFKLLKH